MSQGYARTDPYIAASGSNGSITFNTLTFGALNGLNFYTTNGSLVGSYTVPALSNSSWSLSAGLSSETVSNLVFSNSNGVTFGLSSGTLTASHNGITSQSNPNLSLYAVSNTTQSSSGTANVTNLSFAGAGVASVGITNGSIVVSVPAGGGGITNINVSAGTTSNNLSNLVFGDLNGISFGLNGSTVTASHNGLTTAAQSTQTVQINGSYGNISLNVGSSLSSSNNGSSITFGLASDITTALQSAGAYLTTAMASNAGSNFIYSSATVNATNASVTLGSSALSISVADPVTTNGLISAINISAGTTSSNLSAFQFVNSNGLSWTLDAGSKVYATVKTDYLTTARASTDGIGLNTAATNVTWTVDSQGISFNAAGYAGTGTSATNASVTLNSNGLAINVAAGAGNTLQYYSLPWANSGMATNSSIGNSTLYFQPFDIYENVYASRINFYISLSGALSAGNSTGTCSVGAGYALYTMNGTAADSRTLKLLTSYSMTLVRQSMSSNTQYAVTHYNGLQNATSHTTSQYAASNANASTYLASSVNGLRAVAFPVNSTLTPGRYWLGFSVQTVTGNAMTNNVSVAITQVGPNPYIAAWGTSSSATNASVFRAQQGWGSYSAQSAAWPNTIAFTTDAIRAAVSQTLIHFDIKGYSTSTNML